MCLSKAWYSGQSETEPVMQEVARIRVEDGEVVLNSLFGEEKRIEADIAEVDFTRNIVLLREK
jgi:predicted RNA-binding protein